jgi:hypothetical protein
MSGRATPTRDVLIEQAIALHGTVEAAARRTGTPLAEVQRVWDRMELVNAGLPVPRRSDRLRERAA